MKRKVFLEIATEFLMTKLFRQTTASNDEQFTIFIDHETQTEYEGNYKYYTILIETVQEPLRQYSCIRLEVMRTTWKDTKRMFS
jgi:polyphosphate kinase